ncbi:hypothetical protein KAFR_0B05400 [Kazachstania africana CBS 2517]|uniref:BHLH domain-containing protein n=1 Tax=Kazachstania africana (strain ATCC 22294 / BCRC 22015 / CBS 2517 / CECT 1963 / NBRC 1671 / NRRL Y-8276) TaxID=1071382 RepID=H2AR35_KAZAF|nr:hypothetical protein KAFR_0B05400 [Kazachstania africana CBS 2517]CCF56835.1 hypothetical protein KAFR_0B05400 [Kazachstania africana CBS 2517]
MNHDSNIDLHDMFDLNTEIDFETAYQMLSNIENASPNYDDKHLNFVSTRSHLHNDMSNMFDYPHGHLQGHFQEPQEQHHQDSQLVHQRNGHYYNHRHQHNGHGHDYNHKHQLPLQHDLTSMHSTAPYANGIAGDELLSTFETNAIEHFLDTLITNDKLDKQNSNSDSLNSTFVTNDVTRSPKKRQSQKAIATLVKEIPVHNEETPTHFEEKYNPGTLLIPEIKIDDSKIPVEIMNDMNKVKKWKHVQVEKIRRNLSRDAFDELIALLSNRSTITVSTKRVPKHILLSYVIEDIRSIVNANKQLESMLQA